MSNVELVEPLQFGSLHIRKVVLVECAGCTKMETSSYDCYCLTFNTRRDGMDYRYAS